MLALRVAQQSSMSEEHPPSPTKFENAMASGDSRKFQDLESSSMEHSKIITYRPLKSVGGSEDSDGGQAATPTTPHYSDDPYILPRVDSSDSASDAQQSSKTELKQLNSNLYRYVTSSFGAH